MLFINSYLKRFLCCISLALMIPVICNAGVAAPAIMKAGGVLIEAAVLRLILMQQEKQPQSNQSSHPSSWQNYQSISFPVQGNSSINLQVTTKQQSGIKPLRPKHQRMLYKKYEEKYKQKGVDPEDIEGFRIDDDGTLNPIFSEEGVKRYRKTLNTYDQLTQQFFIAANVNVEGIQKRVVGTEKEIYELRALVQRNQRVNNKEPQQSTNNFDQHMNTQEGVLSKQPSPCTVQNPVTEPETTSTGNSPISTPTETPPSTNTCPSTQPSQPDITDAHAQLNDTPLQSTTEQPQKPQTISQQQTPSSTLTSNPPSSEPESAPITTLPTSNISFVTDIPTPSVETVPPIKTEIKSPWQETRQQFSDWNTMGLSTQDICKIIEKNITPEQRNQLQQYAPLLHHQSLQNLWRQGYEPYSPPTRAQQEAMNDTLINTAKTIVYPFRLGWNVVSNLGESISYFQDGPVESNIQNQILSYVDRNVTAIITGAPEAIDQYAESANWKLLKQIEATFSLEGDEPNRRHKQSSLAANNAMALLQLPPEHTSHIATDAEQYQDNQNRLFQELSTTEQFLMQTYLRNAHELQKSSNQRRKLARQAKQHFDNRNFAKAKRVLGKAINLYNNEKELWWWWIASRNALTNPNDRTRKVYQIPQPSYGINLQNFQECNGTLVNHLIHEDLLGKLVKSNQLYEWGVNNRLEVNKNRLIHNALPFVARIQKAARRNNQNNNILLARAMANFSDALNDVLESAATIYYDNTSVTGETIDAGIRNFWHWLNPKKNTALNYDDHFRQKWQQALQQASNSQKKSLRNTIQAAKNSLKDAIRARAGNDQNTLNQKILQAAALNKTLDNQQDQTQAAILLCNLLFDNNNHTQRISTIIRREHTLTRNVHAKNARLARPISTIFSNAFKELYGEALRQQQEKVETDISNYTSTQEESSPKNESISAPQENQQTFFMDESAPEVTINNNQHQKNHSLHSVPHHFGITSGTNGCYFNAAIQCLTNCLPHNLTSQNPEIQALLVLHNSPLAERCVDLSILRNHVIRSVNDEFQAGEQADAGATVTFFLDHIASSGCQAFNIGLQSVIQRPCCASQSITQDPAESFLTLDIDQTIPRNSLVRSLERYFNQEQGVHVHCDTCNHDIENATKQLQATGLPETLVLQLKRFSNNQEKIHNPVSFPIHDLNLSTIAIDTKPARNVLYQLSGIIQHAGNAHGGHYVAYINRNNQWYHCDDDLVRPISVQEIEKIAAQGIDGEFVPYILFYNQVHEVEPHPDVTNNENIDFSDLEPTLYAEVIEQFQSQAQQIFDNNPEQDNDLGELIWIIPTDNGEELIVRAEKDDDGQINVTVTPQSTTPAPAPNDPDDDPDEKKKEDQSKQKSDEVINEILENSTPGEKTRGKTTQFEKPGGFREALDDFEKMKVNNIRRIVTEKGEIRIGKLPDGRNVNVREFSSDTRPTIEIQNDITNNIIKIRYGAK